MGAGYLMSAGTGVSVGLAPVGGFGVADGGDVVVSNGSVGIPVLSVACLVAAGVDVGLRPWDGVAVTTTVTTTGVGSNSATLSGSGVAVTIMYHGVCVGGALVGSGVVPHPAAMLAKAAIKTSSMTSCLMA